MNQQTKEPKSLPLFRKIGYGVGDAGANFCWTFVASFIMLYCTNILGVSAAVIGTIMMFSKVLDGVSDVIMGRIIDATHHKMGKARFWYFVSAFPVALTTFLLFNVPGGLSEKGKYVYIFIVYTLMGAIFYTMSNIAYSSLTSLVTKNPKDRVEMGSYRFIFAILALLFISSFTSGMVDYFGGGQKGWRVVSLIYALLCFVLLMVPVFAVRELPAEELYDVNTADEKKEEPGIKESLIMLVKNKYFLMILMIYLVKYFCNGITSGMGIYFATYQLKNPSLLGMITMAGMLPVVIVLPFVSKMTDKYGIRTSAIVGNLIGVAGGVLIIFGGLKGMFPLLMIGLVLKAVGSAPLTGGLNALIAEADDYSFYKFGKRITGTVYSCSSVGMKIGTGIGTAACGFLLEWGRFNGAAKVQLSSAIATINWSYLLASALQALFLAVILFFLTVEKDNQKLKAIK